MYGISLLEATVKGRDLSSKVRVGDRTDFFGAGTDFFGAGKGRDDPAPSVGIDKELIGCLQRMSIIRLYILHIG